MTVIDELGGSGASSVIVPAESVELNPPPSGCDGGVSKVRPAMSMTPPGWQGSSSVEPDDVSTRRSAKPAGAGEVVARSLPRAELALVFRRFLPKNCALTVLPGGM